MIAIVNLPGTIDYPVGAGFVGEGGIPLDYQTTMPVCTLSQRKYISRSKVTDLVLTHANFLKAPFSSGVDGMKERIQEFGKQRFGADYIGCHVHSYNKKKQIWDVSYIFYVYTWSHDKLCTQKHSTPLPEEILTIHGFQRPPNPPYWSKDWSKF